jgi:hypothetical protein
MGLRLKIATFTILMLSAVGMAQADSSSSPFSRQDEQLMSSVWPKIREARDYDDIDWKAVGLARPPGDSSARRLMADNWSRLRDARRFDDIDWRDVRDSGDRTSAQRYDEETGPFTRQEARELSAIWPKIREASSFADIDWKAEGLSRAPGDREAQAFVTAHWGSLRRAARFEDIDWRKEYGDR